MRFLALVVAATSVISFSTYATSGSVATTDSGAGVANAKLVKANFETREGQAAPKTTSSKPVTEKSKQVQRPNSGERYADNIQGLPATDRRYRYYD